MFYYFGYGSNMNLVSVKAKGLAPLSADPAVLRGWRLVFDVPDFFRIEGANSNIEMATDEKVHGVLYCCPDDDLPALDELEAVGACYLRQRFVVHTYDGRGVSAYAYVGIADRLESGHQPSRRYMNILIRGAESMKLSPAYIAQLRAQEVRPDPVYRPFTFPSRPAEVFASSHLRLHRNVTALAGAVFDMTDARPEHHYLRDFFAGKDMTLFLLKRMDTSDGSESFADIVGDRMSNEQRRYLTNYLHEFEREYRYIGRMEYQVDLKNKPRFAVGVGTDKRPMVPARQVMENAERINSLLGHENLGFLSQARGFMPLAAPLQSLPDAFLVWDDVVRELPALYRSLTLRPVLAALPILDAGPEYLSDRYLLRAAAVLAMLSHAYHYVETTPPSGGLEALARPWAQVRQRLGREQEVLSYIDLIVYNWRLIDSGAADDLRLSNMRLLFPTVGNNEEQRFYLTQTEILARSGPILGAVIRCQESAVIGDAQSVKAELATINACLQLIVQDVFSNINPNRDSPTYVDPVIWAKTVAPFAVPLRAGVLGPSGTSSPLFNLLDAFFSRRTFETFLGKEIRALRHCYPPFWRDFIEAVGKISVADYVRKCKDRSLDGALKDAVEVYAGDNGFLGRHRMKVFGYLEVAFKVGRSVTIGGFSGLFKDRTWEQVDSELEHSRVERLVSFPRRCHHAIIKSVGQTHASAPAGVKHVVLDISAAGIRYQPGDRCGILPENTDDLVGRTLEALGAKGNETIRLTDEWIAATRLRYGFKDATTVKLVDLLRFGRIRPVELRLAEALHAISQNPVLGAAIRDQTTTRWELWDLLSFLRNDGLDVTRLWKSEFHAADYISRVLPPERFRMYSISSAPDDTESASEIHLTVGRVRYISEASAGESGRERFGTASNFLATSHARRRRISFVIERPSRFGLPKDDATPIVLIAGGTGVAPFRSFIAERQRRADAGKAWLLLGLRSRDYFYYQDEFVPGVAAGSLRLDVVFSRDDVTVQFQRASEKHGAFTYTPGPAGYIQDLLLRPDVADELVRQLRSVEEGGEGANLYVCGRTRFAKSIDEALTQLFADRSPAQSPEERLLDGRRMLCQITAEGRLMEEVFTHSRSWNVERRLIDVSDVVDHNDEANGHWLIIDNIVYDLSRFIGTHPGGATILRNYAGTDGTQGFQRVHHGKAEIEALRDLYEIGAVRRLDFAAVSCEIVRPGQPARTVALATLYRSWTTLLFLVVEMQNALALDQSVQRGVTTFGEAPQTRTPYKLQRSIETHQRFCQSYLRELTGPPLIQLWELTYAMCGADPHDYGHSLAAFSTGGLTGYPESAVAALGVELELSRREGQAADFDRVGSLCRAVEQADAALLSEMKRLMKAAVRIFETHESEALTLGAVQLLAALEATTTTLAAYCRQLKALFEGHGRPLAVDATATASASSAFVPAKVLMSNDFWTVEEESDAKVLLLRRSPKPVISLDDLVVANAAVLAHFRRGYSAYGVVVDMRQAPPRNDTGFENAMAELRMGLATNFARVAVLLESATGLLQVNRIGRNDSAQTFATQNEPAAIKFAKGAA